MKGLKITFYGGAGEVTGSNFLVEFGEKASIKRILVDCGLFLGLAELEERNWQAWPYNPALIDYLFVTHAHIDHIGRIPRLVRDGFRGVIYSTPPTRELARVMLANSQGLMEKERAGQGHPPLFSSQDIEAALALWQTRGYQEPLAFSDFSFSLTNAGHTLGSAIIEFSFSGSKLVFTGDLGNSPSPLLSDGQPVKNADFLVVESVYGDQRHRDVARRRRILEQAIEGAASRGGTLVIPSFSFERTQEIIYEISQLMAASRIPLLPIILDSPLAIKITEIYKQYQDYLKPAVISLGRLFEFPQLFMVETVEESQAIEKKFGNVPKIIMAGAGMSTGGRVLAHELTYLPEAKNTLFLVGYQPVGSLGRRLLDGSRRVKISGREIEVKAQIMSSDGYSGHLDTEGLLNFIAQSTDSLKKVFVVMGEPKASLFLVQRIRDYLGISASAPAPGESVEIEI